MYSCIYILQTKTAANRISLSEGVITAIQQVDRKLIYIPVMFLLLRMWGTVQFIVASSIHKTDCHHCISQPASIFLYILGYLQVSHGLCHNHIASYDITFAQGIGDGGQGWGNLILYVFTTKEIRERLFSCHKSPTPKSSAIQRNQYNRFYNTTQN